MPHLSITAAISQFLILGILDSLLSIYFNEYWPDIHNASQNILCELSLNWFDFWNDFVIIFFSYSIHYAYNMALNSNPDMNNSVLQIHGTSLPFSAIAC